ncbi:Tyrosine/nicotianamine aminotransferase [Trema orientale]|uniref:Tyrosine/nicotianamine aminotransferase n=1 Tax=Trema orientale TaxID=63057 RepID=A0A2P5DNH1_TREOI|nr:Tyrosine/nicotianamine aminotransferase [Trema orientale]
MDFRVDEGEFGRASSITVRGVINMLSEKLKNDDDEPRPVVPLAHGDPSRFPCFPTAATAEDAVVDSVRAAKLNYYAPSNGLHSARRSPGANVLLPRPGFPHYEARASCTNLEVRHYNLIPEQGWEIDLENVKALSDENTVAMVIINPGNPCGNVYTRQHLEKVAEMARKLRFLVVTDEVYEHLTFGSAEFVPMGVYGSIVPVVTLGSISKRWCVPGWRLGWLVTNDPNGILKKSGVSSFSLILSNSLTRKIIDSINVSVDPVTFIQGAVPDILQKTKEEYFSKIIDLLREAADTCYNMIKEIPVIDCPQKPEGSLFVMVKLNVSLLDDINDDLEFCLKLAQEESVVVMPGMALGMKNWLWITFAIEPSLLEDGLRRVNAFCQRHANKQ